MSLTGLNTLCAFRVLPSTAEATTGSQWWPSATDRYHIWLTILSQSYNETPFLFDNIPVPAWFLSCVISLLQYKYSTRLLLFAKFVTSLCLNGEERKSIEGVLSFLDVRNFRTLTVTVLVLLHILSQMATNTYCIATITIPKETML